MLDLVFVANFGMGIAGVAWATIIAQAVSGALCVIRILRMRDQDGLRMRDAVRLRQMQIVEREIEKAWGMKL